MKSVVYGWMGMKSEAAKIVSLETNDLFRVRTHTDDSHSMAVESDPPSGLGSRIDKAEQVFLASLNFPE